MHTSWIGHTTGGHLSPHLLRELTGESLPREASHGASQSSCILKHTRTCTHVHTHARTHERRHVQLSTHSSCPSQAAPSSAQKREILKNHRHEPPPPPQSVLVFGGEKQKQQKQSIAGRQQGGASLFFLILPQCSREGQDVQGDECRGVRKHWYLL